MFVRPRRDRNCCGPHTRECRQTSMVLQSRGFYHELGPAGAGHKIWYSPAICTQFPQATPFARFV
jgi:hypothetical protein